MAGIAIALLGVVVLAVAIIALQRPNGRTSSAGTATSSPKSHTTARTVAPSTSRPAPTTSAPSTPVTTSASSSAAAGRLPLVVLNNTTVTGLARLAAQRFEAGGWTVTSFGNYQNDILSTCAYYDPAVPGAHQAAQALQAQFPAIKRVQPKFPELPAGPIVVVLTPDYS